VGVILRYPSGRAEEASATDVLAMADEVAMLPIDSSEQASPRQPPTLSDTTAAAFPCSTLAPSVVDSPTRGRRRSSSVSLSPPTLSPAPTFEQSQSVPLTGGRAASLQRVASSQRRSQRLPSLSPTQWTGSYGSPSPPIGSDIESEYPAARPTVYRPWSTAEDQAPLQVGADIRQPGSTNDPRIHIPEMVTLAAEVQPSSSYVAHARTDTRSDIAICPRDIEPMHIDVAAHSYVSPSIIADVAPSSIVSRPSTAGQRQVKSSVPIGINEPSFGSVRGKSQSGMAGFESVGVESRCVAEPRPPSVITGHPLSEGIARPSPVHARPTPTQTPTSMSAGLMSAAHTVCPSSVDAHVARPTLADDEPAMRQPTPAYTGQYAAVCTGLQVQTSAETLTAQSLLLLGR